MVRYFNMSDGALCYSLATIVSIGLLVYGFMQILGKQMPAENDSQVVQRQIRGFAFLMLAQVSLLLGMSLCSGMGFSLGGVFKAMRL